ncbi:MAG: hypothetical protein V1835_05765 [Candidatus Micrarchaeota archaeon]
MAEKADDKKEDLKGEKKSKQKEIIAKLTGKDKPAEPPQPEPEPGKHHRVTTKQLLATFKQFLAQYAIFDFKALSSKWLYLIAILLLTSFSFVMLSKVGFAFSDIFDFQRISLNIDKVLSISFFLFLFMYSLSLAFATLFGFNQRPASAFVAITLVTIIVFAAAYLYDQQSDIGTRYVLAYLWLGFGIVLATLFGTLLEGDSIQSLSLNRIWKTVGQMLFVLMIVAVLFAFVKVSSDKDAYFDVFVSSVASLTPQLQGQLQGSLGDSIAKIDLSGEEVASMVGEDTSKYVPKSNVTALVRLQYTSFREANINAFTKSDDKDFAREHIPASYDSLDISTKNKLVDDTIRYLAAPETSQVTGGAVAKVWPELQKKLAERVKSAPVKKVTETDVTAIGEQLNKVAFVRQFKDYFAFFVALLVFSLLSFVNWAIRAVTTLFCYAITQVI